jgi:hypothetical protein
VNHVACKQQDDLAREGHIIETMPAEAAHAFILAEMN